MPKKIITIDGFAGGLANDPYDPLNKQTFQTAKDLEVFTATRTLSPHLALGADLTDKTRNNIKLSAAIKASDGRIYFKGFDESTGAVLTIWDAGTSLGSSSSLTAETTASGAGGGFGMVEFNSDIFYYESSSIIQAFDIGCSTIVTNAVAVNNTCPIFVHEGLNTMFYTVSNKAIGKTTSSTISSTAALTFGDDQRPIMMTHLGQFVVIGLNTANNSKTSKLAIWDGSSTAIDDLIDIGDTGLQGIANLNGTIYMITTSNAAGFGKFNIIRLYRWRGAGVELVREIDLKPTAANAVTVNPASIAVHKDTLFFGMNADTANTMTIDNGVYAYNQKTDILTLDRVVEDTTNIDVSSITIIEGTPVVTWFDGTNYRINHVPASTNKSALGVYESNIFPLDGTSGSKYGKIESILLNHAALPASCGFTVAIKHYSNYDISGSVPSADSYTDLTTPQGSGNSTGKTQSTTNATYTRIQSPNDFDRATHAQIKISLDEINSADSRSEEH